MARWQLTQYWYVCLLVRVSTTYTILVRVPTWNVKRWLLEVALAETMTRHADVCERWWRVWELMARVSGLCDGLCEGWWLVSGLMACVSGLCEGWWLVWGLHSRHQQWKMTNLQSIFNPWKIGIPFTHATHARMHAHTNRHRHRHRHRHTRLTLLFPHCSPPLLFPPPPPILSSSAFLLFGTFTSYSSFPQPPFVHIYKFRAHTGQTDAASAGTLSQVYIHFLTCIWYSKRGSRNSGNFDGLLIPCWTWR